MNNVEQTFEVGQNPEVAIRQSAGSVKFVDGGAGQVHVSIVGGGAGKVPIAQFGNRIEIGKEGKMRGNYRTVVSVPESAEVVAALASADFSATTTLGSLIVKAASSDVDVKEVSGEVVVKIASGDVRIGRADGRIKVSSASGDVLIGEAGSATVAHTASGDIEIEVAHDEVEVKTASGELLIRRLLGGGVTAKTMSGNIVVGVQTGSRAEVELSTLSGKVDLPEGPATEQPSDPDRKLTIWAKSVSGDITLKRVS